MMVETYLRRGQRSLQQMLLRPGVRGMGAVLAYGGSGFLLSAGGLAGSAQPLAMGLICAQTGWRALIMCIGAMLGYPFFWGLSGNQGIVWSASGGLLALLLGKREETRDQPLMIPAIAAFLTAVTGLSFRLLLGESVPVGVYFLRIALTFLSGVLFTQVTRCRDAIADWLASCLGVLALAQILPGFWLGPGYIAAGLAAVTGAFPAAALAGLGLDLARITPVPMTAVLCAAYMIRLIPLAKAWQHYASPGFGGLAIMAATGIWDPKILPGLFLGGMLGALIRPSPGIQLRRGDSGAAQVRLEMGAAVLSTTAHLLLESEPAPVDTEAVLEKAVRRACTGCSARNSCPQKTAMTLELLKNPLEADCRKPGRLIPELHRAQEQLRYLQADRKRRQEYRAAVLQQYRFLSDYLRQLADQLPRKHKPAQICFRVEAAARSRGKERANGDRCLAFPVTGGRYFVLLCDGMGTGVGAAQEGETAARLLKQMLSAGFPAAHALKSLNNLLVLRGAAGAVTVDLAEVRLDTGQAAVYKWGAAPSWILDRKRAEKIGTATPPPGLSVESQNQTVKKLSLCRGEVLILLSDGVDGEDVLGRVSLTPDVPPGELAAQILEKGCRDAEDDATAAVIRLRPVSMATS